MDQHATQYLHERQVNSIFEHLVTVLLLDRPAHPREYLIGELKKLQQHAKAGKGLLPPITPRLPPITSAHPSTPTKSTTFITNTPLPLLSTLAVSSPSLPTPTSSPKSRVPTLPSPSSSPRNPSSHSSPKNHVPSSKSPRTISPPHTPTPPISSRTRSPKPLTPLTTTHSPRDSTNPTHPPPENPSSHDSSHSPRNPSHTPRENHSSHDSAHSPRNPSHTPRENPSHSSPRNSTHLHNDTLSPRDHSTPPTPTKTNPKTPRAIHPHTPPVLQPLSPFSNSLAPSSLSPSSSSSIPSPSPLRKGLASSHDIGTSSASLLERSRPATSIHPTTRTPIYIPEIKHTSHITRDHTEQGQRTVNQYILFHHIGRGSYGVVKLAMDSESRQSYAVKILRKSRLRKIRTVMPGKVEDALLNVKREIALMKKLHHPNVVQLYEVLDDPNFDKLFMVLEYVQDGPVMHIEAGKTTNPVEPEKAWSYFRDIIKGLDYLHAQKVIHRDIKPENLLIDANGTLKISDFGVSFMFEGDDDALRKTSGTPAFFAPEICSGAKEYFSGRAVDIWAVGVTLYCFIFGRVPFMARTIMQIYEKITTEEVTYDFPVDPVLEGLLNGLLDKNPNTRITMDEIKKHPWVTKNGEYPIIEEPEPVEVSEHEVNTCIRQISSLSSILKAKQLARRMSVATRRFSVPDVGVVNTPYASLQEMMASAYAAAGLGVNVNHRDNAPSNNLAKSRSLEEATPSPRETHDDEALTIET